MSLFEEDNILSKTAYLQYGLHCMLTKQKIWPSIWKTLDLTTNIIMYSMISNYFGMKFFMDYSYQRIYAL